MDPQEECVIEVKVEVGDPETAFSVVSSLNVDNKLTPKGVTATCQQERSLVICEVRVKECDDPRRVLTARNTIDDLLINLRASLASIGALKGSEG